MWDLRMKWLEEVKEVPALAWESNLSFRLRDQLNLSCDKMDQLRYCISHHRVGKRLVPRRWVVNPWTGSAADFPQPILLHTVWTPLVKAFITDHGFH